MKRARWHIWRQEGRRRHRERTDRHRETNYNENPALFPSDLAQLKPYFQVPVDSEILARYRFERPDKLNEWLTDILVKEVAPPVDEEYVDDYELGSLHTPALRSLVTHRAA